jgi:hypothetical protein
MPKQYKVERSNDQQLRKQVSENESELSDRIGGPDDSTGYDAVANRWRGPWLQQTYYRGDQVTDGLWLMIANKTTTDKAGPVPSGTSVWLMPDTPTWSTTPQYTGTVYSGIRIQPQADRMLAAKSIRVWIQDAGIAQPENAKYRVLIRDNNTGRLEVGEEFDATIAPTTTPQWVTVNITPSLILEGDDVWLLLQQWNNAATTDYTFPYVRAANTQTAIDPGAGNWNTNNQADSFRISTTDATSPTPQDRSTELGQVIPGTTIRVEDQADPVNVWADFSVVTVNNNGTWFEYGVVYLGDGPLGAPPVLATCDVKLSIPIPVATNYVTLTDHFLGNPSVSGYISFDEITGGTDTQDGYGIDVQFQDYIESPDWDVQALSSTDLPSTGSASAFGPAVNIVDSNSVDFWDRWLDAEKENLAKFMNNEVVPPGPPPTWLETFRAQQFVAYTAERNIRVWDAYVIREVNWLESVALIGPGRAAVILQP